MQSIEYLSAYHFDERSNLLIRTAEVDFHPALMAGITSATIYGLRT